MRGIVRVATGLAVFGVAAPAGARPVYYHKPAVEQAAFVSDISGCSDLAAGARAPSYATYSPNLVTAGASALFAGFFGSRERRGIIDNILRTCMADKGYRRVEVSPATNRELQRLAPDQRLARLFVLASAAAPAGTVLPR